MTLVRCISERMSILGQLSIGTRYWMDEDSIWRDLDGEEYVIIYSCHARKERYRLGQFKTSHFEVEHICTDCIYSTYPKDCKKICMVVAGKEKLA